jgi:hypothetical protein
MSFHDVRFIKFLEINVSQALPMKWKEIPGTNILPEEQLSQPCSESFVDLKR